MRARTILALVTSILASGPAVAQQSSHHAHDGNTSPAGHAEAERCLESFDRVVADGRGFGMAFAADRNGYPGPLHVLELRDALALTPAQESRVRTLEAAMFAESRPSSAALLAAERRLADLFARGRATEAELVTRLREVERRRGDVRLVHLRYHLMTRDVLTEPQRLVYQERRWGSGAAGR